jgi:26S proteasome regulatory subunit N12
MATATKIDPKIQEALPFYEKLKSEWGRKPPNIGKTEELLTSLKNLFAEGGFYPSDSNEGTHGLHIARDTLEIAAQCAIEKGDIPAFERALAQLKPFYFDLENRIPESPYRYLLLGLNLLCLLSQNRLADFHTELELLPPKDIQSNPYIKHPVSLEQYLMEGSYNKVFLAKGNVPSPLFTFFMDILLNTIRDEIAYCMEKSYRQVSLKEAARILYLTKQDELAEIAKKHGWKLESDQCFHFADNQSKSENEHVPADEIATQMIQYAREMEIII